MSAQYAEQSESAATANITSKPLYFKGLIQVFREEMRAFEQISLLSLS
jgi:hypothetical protein